MLVTAAVACGQPLDSVAGLVVSVDSPSLGRGRFVRAADRGRRHPDVRHDRSSSAATSRRPHLGEHMRLAQAVRVTYRRDGERRARRPPRRRAADRRARSARRSRAAPVDLGQCQSGWRRVTDLGARAWLQMPTRVARDVDNLGGDTWSDANARVAQGVAAVAVSAPCATPSGKWHDRGVIRPARSDRAAGSTPADDRRASRGRATDRWSAIVRACERPLGRGFSRRSALSAARLASELLSPRGHLGALSGERSRSRRSSTRLPSRSSWRNQTATATTSATRNTRSPPTHMIPPASAGPRAASGPSRARASRSADTARAAREDDQPRND